MVNCFHHSSREVEGTALRNLGNPIKWGANSVRNSEFLKDEARIFLIRASQEAFLLKETLMTQMGRNDKMAYLDALKERVLVFDGAMGTSLQAMHLNAEDYGGEAYTGCNDVLVLTAPEAVGRVHQSFLLAGADVLETNTFRSNRLTLAEFGLAEKTFAINHAAALVARNAILQYGDDKRQRFVAGSMGPSGKLISSADPAMNDIRFEELSDIYCEQARALLQGGVDLLLLETANDLLELKAAVAGIGQAFANEAFRVPVQAQVTLDVHGKMLMGTDIKAVLAVLEGLAVDVIGLNCSTGPEHMRQAVAWLSAHSEKPISIIPNAGLPVNIDGEAVYTMSPQRFADELLGFVAGYGIRAIGGCCGTRPEHIRALVEGLAKIKVFERKPKLIPSLASIITATPVHQEPKPLIIGERLNAAGSKAFKRLLLAKDLDGILQIAREQVDFGAHALDLNVALAEGGNEAQTMATLSKQLSLEVPVPLVIDSVDVHAIEAGLQVNPGRCLINSVHFEEGEAKVREVFALAKKYSAMVVCLTIDEQGMALTAERKLAIAKRFLPLAEEFGLKAHDLFFDTLTFTLASGDSSYNKAADETLKAIALIKKEIPEAGQILGVSNVSFGLGPQARKVLNSVFLYKAIQAGLDAAIINPAQITAYTDIPEEARALASALIHYSAPNALDDYVDWFEKNKLSSAEQDKHTDPLQGLSPEQRLKMRVLSRSKVGVEDDISEILDGKDKSDAANEALRILNRVLLPAMQEVGDAFGKGELILPFVLQSAEVMKQAVSVLERYLDKKESLAKGKIVLATVFGDIHDIGKNLVKTILENNGYEVIDLGKQVPIDTIIQRAIEEDADAIGLSALLVATSKQMKLAVEALNARGLDIPVIIGGAAINEEYGLRILETRDGNLYSGGVFYSKDAFDGLAVMDALVEPSRKEQLYADLHKKVSQSLQSDKKAKKPESQRARDLLPAADFIPKPKSWRVRHLSLSIATILPYLDKNALYRVSWGAKGVRGEAWQSLKQEFDLRLERMLLEVEREKWLEPQALLGFWPCQALEENLYIYSSEHLNGEPIGVLQFERSKGKSGISLADYFLEIGQTRKDVVGLQVVTVGRGATEKYGQLENQSAYSEGYYVHGLAVRMAEAVAEYCSILMREELGLPATRGKRFSWGYPAAPDVREHFKLFRLLPAEERLGMRLTSAGQMIPEQSTAAIFVHHQAVRYTD